MKIIIFDLLLYLLGLRGFLIALRGALRVPKPRLRTGVLKESSHPIVAQREGRFFVNPHASRCIELHLVIAKMTQRAEQAERDLEEVLRSGDVGNRDDVDFVAEVDDESGLGADPGVTTRCLESVYLSAKLSLRSLMGRLFHVLGAVSARNVGMRTKESHTPVAAGLTNDLQKRTFSGSGLSAHIKNDKPLQLKLAPFLNSKLTFLTCDFGPLTFLVQATLNVIEIEFNRPADAALIDAWAAAGFKPKTDLDGSAFWKLKSGIAALRRVRNNLPQLHSGHLAGEASSMRDEDYCAVLYGLPKHSSHFRHPATSAGPDVSEADLGHAVPASPNRLEDFMETVIDPGSLDDDFDEAADVTQADFLSSNAAPRPDDRSDDDDADKPRAAAALPQQVLQKCNGAIRRFLVSLEAVLLPVSALTGEAAERGTVSVLPSFESQKDKEYRRSRVVDGNGSADQDGARSFPSLLAEEDAHLVNLARHLISSGLGEDADASRACIIQWTPSLSTLIRRFETARKVPMCVVAAAALQGMEAVYAGTRDFPVIRKELQLQHDQQAFEGARGNGGNRAIGAARKLIAALVAACVPTPVASASPASPGAQATAAQASPDTGAAAVLALCGDAHAAGVLFKELAMLMHHSAPSGQRIRKWFAVKAIDPSELSRSRQAGTPSAAAGSASEDSPGSLCGLHVLGVSAAYFTTELARLQDAEGKAERAEPNVENKLRIKREFGMQRDQVLVAVAALFQAAANAAGGSAINIIQQRLFAIHGAAVMVADDEDSMAHGSHGRKAADIASPTPAAPEPNSAPTQPSSGNTAGPHQSIAQQLLTLAEQTAKVHDDGWKINAKEVGTISATFLSIRALALRSVTRMLHRCFSITTRGRLPQTPEHLGVPLAVLKSAYTLSIRSLQQLAQMSRPFVIVTGASAHADSSVEATIGRAYRDSCPMSRSKASFCLSQPLWPESDIAMALGADYVRPPCGEIEGRAEMHSGSASSSAAPGLRTQLVVAFNDLVLGIFAAHSARSAVSKFLRAAIMERAIADNVLPLTIKLREQAEKSDRERAAARALAAAADAEASLLSPINDNEDDAAADDGSEKPGQPANKSRHRKRQNSQDYEYLDKDFDTQNLNDRDIADRQRRQAEQQAAMDAALDTAKTSAPLQRALALFRTRREEILSVVASWQLHQDYDWLTNHESHPICCLVGLAEAMAYVNTSGHPSRSWGDRDGAAVLDMCMSYAETLASNASRFAGHTAAVWWNAESLTSDVQGQRLTYEAKRLATRRDFSEKRFREVQQVLFDWIKSDRWLRMTQRTRLRGEIDVTSTKTLDRPAPAFSLFFSHADHAKRVWGALSFRLTASRDKNIAVSNTTSEDPSSFMLRVWAEAEDKHQLTPLINQCMSDGVTSGRRLLAGQIAAEQQSHMKDAHKTARTLNPDRTAFTKVEPQEPWFNKSRAPVGVARSWWLIDFTDQVSTTARAMLALEMRSTRIIIQRRDAEGKLLDVLIGYAGPVTRLYRETLVDVEWSSDPAHWCLGTRTQSKPPADAVYRPDVYVEVVRASKVEFQYDSVLTATEQQKLSLSPNAQGVHSLWVSLEPQPFQSAEMPDVLSLLRSPLKQLDVTSLNLPWLESAMTQPGAAASRPPDLPLPAAASASARANGRGRHQPSGGSHTLDEFQQNAAQNAENHAVSVVRGPPGCGKTTVLSELARMLHAAGYKVLILAHANAAIESVGDNSKGDVKVALSISRQVALRPDAAHDDEEFRFARRTEVDGKAPLAITLGNFRNKELVQPADAKDVRPWAVILDESSQVWDALLLPALSKFNLDGKPWTKLERLVFVGDDHQLSPYSEQTGRIRSLRSAFDAARDLHEQHPEQVPLADLRITYRLPKPLAAAISKYFYSSILEYSRKYTKDEVWKSEATAAINKAVGVIQHGSAKPQSTPAAAPAASSELDNIKAVALNLRHAITEELVWHDAPAEWTEQQVSESWQNQEEAAEVGTQLALLQFARLVAVDGLRPESSELWPTEVQATREDHEGDLAELADEEAAATPAPAVVTPPSQSKKKKKSKQEKTAETAQPPVAQTAAAKLVASSTAASAAHASDAASPAPAAAPPSSAALPFTMVALSGYEKQTEAIISHASAQFVRMCELGGYLQFATDGERGAAGAQYKDRFKGLACNTDAYQGKEADIELISMTRTTQDLGFLEDQRRTNVMLTRAKHALLVTGNAVAAARSVAGTVSTLPRRQQTLAIAGQGLDKRMDQAMIDASLASEGLHPGLWACLLHRCWSSGRFIVHPKRRLKPPKADGFTMGLAAEAAAKAAGAGAIASASSATYASAAAFIAAGASNGNAGAFSALDADGFEVYDRSAFGPDVGWNPSPSRHQSKSASTAANASATNEPSNAATVLREHSKAPSPVLRPSVLTLTQMGFDLETCEAALARTNGDVEAAGKPLCQHGRGCMTLERNEMFDHAIDDMHCGRITCSSTLCLIFVTFEYIRS